MRTYLLFIILLLTFVACDEPWDCTVGHGPKVTRTLPVPNFHSFELAGSDKVFIRQGAEQEVRVEGQENIINLIDLKVRDGYWSVRFRDCTRRHNDLVYYITLPEVKFMAVAGSGSIIAQNVLETSSLGLRVSGSGSISAEIDAASLNSEINGSGDIHVGGESPSAEVNISGSGEYHAYNLLTNDYNIRIRGSGDAYVSAINHIDVSISGSGDVYYKGTPTINSSISGSGKIIAKN
ncbi:head GIN domain-containing protein [soil metagenome]